MIVTSSWRCLFSINSVILNNLSILFIADRDTGTQTDTIAFHGPDKARSLAMAHESWKYVALAWLWNDSCRVRISNVYWNSRSISIFSWSHQIFHCFCQACSTRRSSVAVWIHQKIRSDKIIDRLHSCVILIAGMWYDKSHSVCLYSILAPYLNRFLVFSSL